MFRWVSLSFCLLILGCGDGGMGSGGIGDGSSEEDDTCDSHSDCNSDLFCYDDACDEMFDRNFKITIVSGEASTTTDWDSFGGAPDPFVYFAIGNDDCVTSTEDDNFYPSWNESCTMVLASGSTFEVVMYDEDISEHDIMLTYNAAGNDDLADLVRYGTITLSNSNVELTIRFTPDF